NGQLPGPGAALNRAACIRYGADQARAVAAGNHAALGMAFQAASWLDYSPSNHAVLGMGDTPGRCTVWIVGWQCVLEQHAIHVAGQLLRHSVCAVPHRLCKRPVWFWEASCRRYGDG